MSHPLFAEIDRFDAWARSQFDLPQDGIGGAWECLYDNWRSIYDQFEDFMQMADPDQLSVPEKDRLLYIIARNNELEDLPGSLDEPFLTVLAEHAVSNGRRDDKWQLAVQLHRLTDQEKARGLLLQFVNEDEYVNRRALMELAKLGSGQVECLAERPPGGWVKFSIDKATGKNIISSNA